MDTGALKSRCPLFGCPSHRPPPRPRLLPPLQAISKGPLQAISEGQSLYHNVAQFTLGSFPLYEKASSQAELTQRKCFWWPLARDLPIQGSPFPGVGDGRTPTRGSS